MTLPQGYDTTRHAQGEILLSILTDELGLPFMIPCPEHGGDRFAASVYRRHDVGFELVFPDIDVTYGVALVTIGQKRLEFVLEPSDIRIPPREITEV